jgi:hypothetical protein
MQDWRGQTMHWRDWQANSARRSGLNPPAGAILRASSHGEGLTGCGASPPALPDNGGIAAADVKMI